MAGAVQSFGFSTSMAAGDNPLALLDSLWKEFFKDPSQWWDNRCSKQSPRQPDFKHRFTKKPLWMDNRSNPPWVTSELSRLGFLEEKCIDPAFPTDAFSPTLLWACIRNKDLLRGTRLHNELLQRGLDEKTYSDALVTMYAKCGQIQKARALLDMHNSNSSVPWTALIASYARERQGRKALDCFEQMQREGIPPDAVTYSCVLKVCAMNRALGKGKQIHDEILRQRLPQQDIVLGGALVDMYAKCGALGQARSVLEKLPSRNVVSWNALITGYAQEGHGQKALECFQQMQGEGILPDAVTYVCMLKACAAVRDIDTGKQIHDEILRRGLLKHEIALGGALVDMYAECGSLSQAQRVLEKLPSCNIVSWNALITGYVQNGLGQQALDCFKQMQHAGIPPDVVTYTCLVKSCAMISAIDIGIKLHEEILKQGLLKHDIVLGGALVDMYAKFGALARAQSVLEKLPIRDVISWSILIAGYAQEGQCEQALKCFEEMQCEGIFPDRVTFLCLLNLCSHLGLVEKGQELFDSMGATYGLKPDVECYTCMVNLLGCSGNLVKAAEVIQEMPISADSGIWHCLLGACRKWVDVKVGTWAFEQAVELDKCDGAAYVLMGNIYAAAGMLEKVKAIEALRIKNKAWKQPCCGSWTDSNNTVHKIFVDGIRHAQTDDTDLKLDDIALEMS